LYNIEVTYNNNFQWDIIAGNHFIATDAPEKEGGDNEGPDPSEIFLSSIGSASALAITKYMKSNDIGSCEDFKLYVYCNKKELPARLEDISIRIDFPAHINQNLKKALMEEVEKNIISNTLLISPAVSVEEVF